MLQEIIARIFYFSNNKQLPFVFAGVNATPEKYGFNGCHNITGILEEEHFVESVRLLKEIVPDVSRIAVILDEDHMWDGVVKRMKEKLGKLPDVKFTHWEVINSLAAYKQMIMSLQTMIDADAIALLGIFTYKDESGRNVPYTDVLRWTATNSRLPDFSFWKDRVSYGTLCSVTVSGYEQGLAAGRMARGILAEGKGPSSFMMAPTVKGEPVVSLARARRIGIPIRTSILLTAEVVQKFAWEE